MGLLRFRMGRAIVLLSLATLWMAAACATEREAPSGQLDRPKNTVPVNRLETGTCAVEAEVKSCKVQIDANNCFVGEQVCTDGKWGNCDTPEGLQSAALSTPTGCLANPCNPDCQFFNEVGPVMGSGGGGPLAPSTSCTDAPPAGIGGTFSSSPATGTLTATANVLDTETVTVGTKTYTFQTVLLDADGNVLIGATMAASLVNLAAAINLGPTAGTNYALSMTLNADAAAVAGATTIGLTAKTTGTPGNSVVTTETSGTLSFASGTLSGGTSQCSVSNYDCDANGPLVCPSQMDCNFNCTGNDACEDCNFNCTAANSCNITCTGNEACEDATFNCFANNCTINCNANEACEDSVILCGGGPGSVCNVNCGPANEACEDTSVLCGADTCNIICAGEDSCSEGVNTNAVYSNIQCTGKHSCKEAVCCGGGDCDIACDGNHPCEDADIELNITGSGTLLCDGNDACQESHISCCGTDCSVACNPGDSDTCEHARFVPSDFVCCVAPLPATNCDLGAGTVAVSNICTQGDACTGTCPMLPPPPLAGDLTYNQTYEATCPGTQSPEWGFLVWDTNTAGISSITFEVRTASLAADLGSATYVNIGLAQLVPDTQMCWYGTGGGCPIDLYGALNAYPAAGWSFLELQVVLKPNGGSDTPVLNNWQITYTCVDNV